VAHGTNFTVAVPGYPHHGTQKGNRRPQAFFDEEDYRAYFAVERSTATPS